MNVRVIGAWWVACLLWSATYLFIKFGVSGIPPLTFAYLRLLLASAVLLPFALSSRAILILSRRDLAYISLAGVLLLGVNYGLLYWGAQFVPSGLVAILQSTTPVIALALGSLSGSETVTLRKLAAVVIGVLGVALIFGAQVHVAGMTGIVGSLAVLGASACVAAAYVWFKGYRKRISPLTMTAVQCIAGAVPLAVLALAAEGTPSGMPWSARALAALLYLGLCGSVLAFWLNYWLLERMDASAMLMMGVAEVPIAVGLGALILGERLPAGTVIGAACVLAGVLLGPMHTPATPQRDQWCKSNRMGARS